MAGAAFLGLMLPPATAGIRYKTKLIKRLKIPAIRTISSLFT
jgi:hypothetical protein